MTGHHHHHHHHQGGDAATVELDWEALCPRLEQEAELRAPLTVQVTDWLGELLGDDAAGVRRLWDVGSGPGVIACQFAQAFPDAEVLAVDPTDALLVRTSERAARLGLADRVRTLRAELPDGLVQAGSADLIWSSKVVHHLGDQRDAVARLADRLRPGGLLAIAEGGLPTRFLPRDAGVGRPGLQARLDVATEDWFTEMREAAPDTRATVEDWPGMLADAGLADTRTRTFLLDLPAPLGPAARAHVRNTLEKLRDTAGERLDGEDRAALDRLLDPDDTAGVMLRPDLFLLSAQTVHTGRRTG